MSDEYKYECEIKLRAYDYFNALNVINKQLDMVKDIQSNPNTPHEVKRQMTEYNKLLRSMKYSLRYGL